MQDSFYKRNKIEIRIMIVLMTFVLGVFMFSAPLNQSKSASAIGTGTVATGSVATTSLPTADQYSRNYLELYCGSFANSVPLAVNPTATMAILSIVGMIERADEIWPNATWLDGPRTFLESIPLVNTAENLPSANPWMAILFTVLAIALYVFRSIKVCKAISQETIDKIERIAGLVINVVIIVLQFSEAATASAASFNQVVKTGATVLGIVIGVITAISCAIVYFIISKFVEVVENIATGIPVVATNAAAQVCKAFLHIFATIFQFVSVYLAAIIGLIFTILCLFGLIKLSKVATYYNHIYLSPLFRRIFKKDEIVEIKSPKLPRKGRKVFADAEYAIPVFSMRKYVNKFDVDVNSIEVNALDTNKVEANKSNADIKRARKNFLNKIAKREILWLLPTEDGPSLVRIRPLRRIKKCPIEILYPKESILYLQKTKRFSRIRTENPDLEIIFSNEYEPHWNYLLETLKAQDYRIVEERILNEKKELAEQKRREKEERKENARREKAERKEAARKAKAERKELARMEKENR